MKKMLSFLTLALLMMGTAAEGASYERMDTNPPPDLEQSFVIVAAMESPCVVEYQIFDNTVSGISDVILVDNTLAAMDMPVERIAQTPTELVLNRWVFAYRLARPPLASDENMLNTTTAAWMPAWSAPIHSFRDVTWSFTSAC